MKSSTIIPIITLGLLLYSVAAQPVNPNQTRQTAGPNSTPSSIGSNSTNAITAPICSGPVNSNRQIGAGNVIGVNRGRTSIGVNPGQVGQTRGVVSRSARQNRTANGGSRARARNNHGGRQASGVAGGRAIAHRRRGNVNGANKKRNNRTRRARSRPNAKKVADKVQNVVNVISNILQGIGLRANQAGAVG